MTLNDLLQAMAVRLKELWPERAVNVDQIPQEGDGAFFVGVTDVKQVHGLDRRHRRMVGLQVLYFRADRDVLSYLAWAETMLDALRALNAGGRVVRLSNHQVRDDETGRYYEFLCDAVQDILEAGPTGEPMEGLDADEIVKGD